MSKSFSVTDAAFDNKQNNQSDFRIMGEAHIRRAAVRIGTEDPEVPDVPVVYIIPQEPEDPTEIDQIGLLSHQVRFEYNQGILKVLVPEEMINAELRIYNDMGQVVYHTKMEQTEEMVHLSTDSRLYIVGVQSGSEYITRKTVLF